MAAGLEGLAAGESPATPGTGSLGPAEARSLRRVYLVALSYPIWHLAAPAEAHDPWILWWLVAASFAGVIVLSLTSRWVAERSRHLFPLCSWLVTLHLYWLASINDMSPFYVVASVTAVVTTFVFIRDRLGLLAYFAFLLGLSVTLYRAEPSMTKLAYWGGILTVLPLGYLRLDWQLRREAMDRQMADELERRVDERTREVRRANECLEAEIAERKRLENELRLSHKMEVLGRIAGGLAHDFNNLLATVNVYAELVLDELEPHTTLYADAEQIQKTTRMASVLTQQLLDLSRGSGDAVVVDANDAIVEAAEMVRGVLPADVTFEHRLCARPLPVRAGPDQLGRVLMNLIVNARDAMPEGGRLTVSAEIRSDGLPAALDADPGEEYALLTVTDTGHGMDAETLSRAFDPFFTRKTGREGSGLGLSIVWGIVDQAGGHVRAESRTGQGARFEVFWPLAAEASARSAVAPETAARTSAAGRILLVEDEGPLRTVLARVLRKAGYEVVEAADGEQALEAFAARAGAEDGDPGGPGFDLVVSDLVMPRMDGYDLAERLRGRDPGLRILLMSGQARHPMLGDRVAPPGIEILHKPFAVADLVSRARRILEGPRA